jgi:hypothetical protein
VEGFDFSVWMGEQEGHQAGVTSMNLWSHRRWASSITSKTRCNVSTAEEADCAEGRCVCVWGG